MTASARLFLIAASTLWTLVAAPPQVAIAAPDGPSRGPISDIDALNPGEIATYTFRIEPGWATFALKGDGRSDLDLALFEADGTPIEVADSLGESETINRWFASGRTIVVAVMNVGDRISAYAFGAE